MSRSGIPTTVFLEFRETDTGNPRLVGTDAIAHIDGRLNYDNAMEAIRERVAQVTSRKDDLECYGYTVPGDYSNKVITFRTPIR